MSAEPAIRDATLAGLWQAYERVRMFAGPAEFGLTVLTMIFAHAVEEDVDLTERVLAQVPKDGTGEISDVAEWAARRLGNVEAFQLVLEEFACRDEILTPRSIAAVMAGTVNIEPGTAVHDPYCRSGELLVSATESGGGTLCWGSTPGPRSATISKMNTRLRGVEARIEHTKTGDLPPTRAPKASRIVVNPPFNADYPGLENDDRWRYGPPPKGNANFAWLQHAVERLEPGGRAAVLMPNGAASSASPRDRRIREGMVTDGCVEALIALPPSLFRATGVPATIWLLEPLGTRRGEVLFIDASGAGHMASRTLRELGDPEIGAITRIVTEWRNGQSPQPPSRTDVIHGITGTLAEIQKRDYNLSPSYSMPSVPTTAEPQNIRQLRARLVSEYATAREKDAEAMETLQKLRR